MAAGIIPIPGSLYGPCEKPCTHRDCANLRKAAESVCRICGKAIIYGVAFYHEQHGYVHADCLEEEVDESMKV